MPEKAREKSEQQKALLLAGESSLAVTKRCQASALQKFGAGVHLRSFFFIGGRVGILDNQFLVEPAVRFNGFLKLVLGGALLGQEQSQLAVAFPEAGFLIHADVIILAGLGVEGDGRRFVVGANGVRAGSEADGDAAAATDAGDLLVVQVDGRSERGAGVAVLTIDVQERRIGGRRCC